MTAAQEFKRVFTPKHLRRIYEERIRFRASVGMDNILPKAFEEKATEHIRLISKKALAGNYRFTRYREVLISKGKSKSPRVISIPTVRDKLALAAYHMFLKETFNDTVNEPLLHTIIEEIAQCIHSGRYNAFVKADIQKFYASIDHTVLLKKIRKKVRKTEALTFLINALTTQTIPRGEPAPKDDPRDRGVPEGLSISNILADIYLSDLPDVIYSAYSGVKAFRYVDDVLILCKTEQAESIKLWLTDMMESRYKLSVNQDKTTCGELAQGVPFLGYVFSDRQISIRSAAKQRLENALENLFRERVKKKEPISEELFVWRLNLKISGCILEGKKYGWMFYYSQMTDLKILFHLDWLVTRFFARFKLKKPAGIKTFVRTYHEITKNVSESTYLINTDRYSNDQKRKVLLDIYGRRSVETLDDAVIDQLFRGVMFKETQDLEHDIQAFS